MNYRYQLIVKTEVLLLICYRKWPLDSIIIQDWWQNMVFRKTSKLNNTVRMKKTKRKNRYKHTKRNTRIYVVRPLAYVHGLQQEKNFTNKYREYKMVWKHSHKTQSHYTQNYSLIQVEALSLSIQSIGLITKFKTAPKTRRSFRFSKIAAQPPLHSPLQRDHSHSHFAMPLQSFTISATPKLLD